jgi:hypothetical protein
MFLTKSDQRISLQAPSCSNLTGKEAIATQLTDAPGGITSGNLNFLPLFTWYLYNLPSITLQYIFCPSLLGSGTDGSIN